MKNINSVLKNFKSQSKYSLIEAKMFLKIMLNRTNLTIFYILENQLCMFIYYGSNMFPYDQFGSLLLIVYFEIVRVSI